MKFNLHLIRFLRNKNQFTQTYVAQQLNVTQGTYRQYEEGTIAISIDRLMDLAELYKVPISLFFREDAAAREAGICASRTGTSSEKDLQTEEDGSCYDADCQGGGSSATESPICTVSININVYGDEDKRKVSDILQMLK